MGMIQSLRYNNGMRRHQSAFEKGDESRFLNKDPNAMDDSKESVSDQEDSSAHWDDAKKERVAKLVAQRRKEVEEERALQHRNTKIKTAIALILVGIVLSFSAYALYSNFSGDKDDNEVNAKLLMEEQKRQEQAFYLLEDAQLYERRKGWKEALIRYEEIIKLYPGHGEARRSISRINQILTNDSLNQDGI